VISLDDIGVQLGKGTAELDFTNVDVLDWTTVLNSLSDGALLGAPHAAAMSLDIHWSNTTRQVLGVSDATNGYQGDYLETQASVDVSVEQAGFTFSGSGNASSGFAEIGHEQNGVFFSDGNTGSNAVLIGPPASSTLRTPVANVQVEPVWSTGVSAGTGQAVHAALALGQGDALPPHANDLTGHSAQKEAAQAARDRVFALAADTAATSVFAEFGQEDEIPLFN
jgi:hypothetical protein